MAHKLTTDDVCRILELARGCSLARLEFQGLLLEFQEPQSRVVQTQVEPALEIPQSQTSSADEVTDSQIMAAVAESLTPEEREEERLALLMIESPVEYEAEYLRNLAEGPGADNG